MSVPIENADILNIILGSTKKFHSVSVADSLEEHSTDMIKLAENSKPMSIKDHYNNGLTATGTEDRVQAFTNYGFSNDTLNWPLWLALYNDSWVFRRAIDKPAQDEVNCGFTLRGNADFSKVYKIFNKYTTDLIELLQWGALFGGSIAVMMFDGIPDEEMKYPLKKDRIKGARMKLYVTDRWYGVSESTTETVTNMKDIDFGKPKMYNITFANGHSYEVHHSYILRYEHRTAPRLVKNGQLQGWGYSEGSHILNELSRDDQLKSAIQSLVNKSLIEVIKMSGMRGVFMGTDKGNEEQLRKRLEMVNWGRTYNSLTFLDKDDDYQEHGFQGLAGLSDILEKNLWMIAAALEMQGILYGDLKGGLSQDADAMARYSVTIKNRCNAYYRPVLRKLLKVIFIMLDIKEEVDFDFNSLIQKEENKEKVESIQSYANTLNILVQAGILSKFQMAVSLRDYLTKDAINISFTDELLNKLKYEEEKEILEAYKTTTNDSVSQNNFGGPDMMNEFSSDGIGAEVDNTPVETSSAAPAGDLDAEDAE